MSQTIMLTAGPPGAGKTTMALEAGKALGWPVIHRDTVKTEILEAGITANEVAASLADNILLTIGDDLLGQGVSVILDGHAAYPWFVRKAALKARARRASMRVVFLNAPIPVRNERLFRRANVLSQSWNDHRSEDEVGEQFRHLPADSLRLRGTGSAQSNVSAILEYVTTLDPDSPGSVAP